MIIRAGKDELEIECNGIFSSSRVFFNATNKRILFDTRRFIFFSSLKSTPFSDVDRIITKSNCVDAYEDIYVFIIILEGKKSEEIFSWEIYNDHSLFSDALFAIFKIMDREFTDRALNNGSVICKSCSRVISKISERCIYCHCCPINFHQNCNLI